MTQQYLEKAAACVIEKDLFTKDRQCLVKDPTADVLVITAIIDRNSKIGIKTEALGLRSCQMQVFNTTRESQNVYEYRYRSMTYSDSCPPAPLETICRLMLEFDLQDHFVAFCYYCERLAADAARDAIYAADADRAAAACAAAHATARAARAADAAAVHAVYAAAEIETYQKLYAFLCLILKETPVALFLFYS